MRATLLVGATFLAATGASAAAPTRLLPLSDTDAYGTNEGGCEFGFRQGRSTYLFMIGHSVIWRTAPGRAGLTVCRISDRQFGAFGDSSASVACGKRRVAVRRTGAVVSHPEADSAEGPATLLLTERGRTRAIRGVWGSAC